MERYDLFSNVLVLIAKYGVLKLHFTEDNVAPGDEFLIFSASDHCDCKIGWRGDLVWVYFSEDEPMLLEDCPISFLESIVKVANETYNLYHNARKTD